MTSASEGMTPAVATRNGLDRESPKVTCTNHKCFLLTNLFFPPQRSFMLNSLYNCSMQHGIVKLEIIYLSIDNYTSSIAIAKCYGQLFNADRTASAPTRYSQCLDFKMDLTVQFA